MYDYPLCHTIKHPEDKWSKARHQTKQIINITQMHEDKEKEQARR